MINDTCLPSYAGPSFGGLDLGKVSPRNNCAEVRFEFVPLAIVDTCSVLPGNIIEVS